MIEYGIFTAEGLLEGQFYSHEYATEVLEDTYFEDDAWVAKVCTEHTDQEEDSCEWCDLENE